MAKSWGGRSAACSMKSTHVSDTKSRKISSNWFVQSWSISKCIDPLQSLLPHKYYFYYFLELQLSVPWNFHPEFLYRGPSKLIIVLYVIIGTLVGSAVGFVIAMKTSKSFNKRVRESVFFKDHTELYQNSVVRKSLGLEDYMPELDELNELYESDERKDGEPANERMGLL